MPRSSLVRALILASPALLALLAIGCSSSSSGGDGGGGAGGAGGAAGGGGPGSLAQSSLSTGAKQACGVQDGGVRCWSGMTSSLVIDDGSGVVAVSAAGDDV